MNECVIPFKVTLLPVIRDQWYDLARKLNIIEIREEEDFFRAGAPHPNSDELRVIH
jgi:hypothetical protein